MIFLRVPSMLLSLRITPKVLWMCRSWLLYELISRSRLRLIIKYNNRHHHPAQCFLSAFLRVGQSFKIIHQFMWTLFREPLEKEYHARLFSRSWLLSAGCCLFAFIVPILILISIGYSWNSYRLSLVEPVLSFQNYQATCLLSSGAATYDSSFTNQLSTNSYQSFVSAGSDGVDLVVSATFVLSNINACTLQLYFKVVLSDRIPTITVLPLHFYRDTVNNALMISSVKQWGTIQANLAYVLPQSSVTSGDGLQYYINGSQSLAMTDTHSKYGIHKNVSLTPSISGSQVRYSLTAGSSSYEGRFTVLGQNYLEEVSLLSNVRTFVPYFIYLFILGWVFLAQPTVRWMLQNKIYQAKVRHHKFKQH